MIKKNLKNIIISAFALIVLLICVLTIVRAGFYSVYYADDYCFATIEGSPIVEVIRNYKTWQGTYSALFFVYTFEPLLHGGLASLRIIMTVTNIMLFSAFIFAGMAFTRKVENDNKWLFSIIMTTLFIYIFTSYQYYNEIYNWYTGIMIYGLPILLGLVAISIILLIKKETVVTSVIICILLFLGVGGNQMICGFLCYLMLSIVVYRFIDKKLNKQTMIYFGVAVFFSAVNAFCPGNFARHGQIDSTGLHPLEAIKDTASVCLNRIHDIYISSDLVVVMFVIIIIALLLNVKELLSKGYFGFSGVLLLLPFVSCFPICLGISSDYMPNRAYFVIDLGIYIVSFNIAIFIGAFLNQKIRETRVLGTLNVVCVLIAIFVFGILCKDGYTYRDNVVYNVSCQLKNGDYQNYYAQFVTMTEKIESADMGTDVILTGEDVPYPIDYHLSFWITNDATNWINEGISGYYKLNSIRQE